jgi:hypothetical protein
MSELKLCLFGDPHNRSWDWYYATYNTSMGTQAVPWMQDAYASMISREFAPDITGSVGDNSTALNSSEKTSLLTASMDAIAAGPGVPVTAVGNHDFEYATLAEVRAVVSSYCDYFQAGVLYGSFGLNGYHVIVLDACYAENTENHNNNNGNIGHGYIPSSQAAWLISDLAATSLPTIIFVHQSLSEFNGTTFWNSPTTDIDRYSVTNRATIRTILEASNKVLAVFEGHQHFSRWCVINGIPYIDLPSLTGITGATLTRPLGGNKGIWTEVVMDSVTRTIAIKVYENDSTHGVRLATDHTIDLNKYAYKPFYLDGDLTEWIATTSVTAAVPADILISNNLPTNPLPNGLLIQGGVSGNTGSVTHTIPAQSGYFIFKVNLQKADINKLIKLSLTDGTTTAIEIQFDALGTITSNSNRLQTYLSGADYELCLVVDTIAGVFSASINGVLKAESI